MEKYENIKLKKKHTYRICAPICYNNINLYKFKLIETSNSLIKFLIILLIFKKN